ncbi:MAG: HupE/UreJ family protein [Gammaproteobacteria bacterium]|nr:HupE/UreJ family protein [Gammaproteobacteria bacterium]
MTTFLPQRFLLSPKLWLSLVLFLNLFLPQYSGAHEARPAYLEVKENPTGRLNINWTRPIRDGRVLAIHPVFPESCEILGNRTKLEMNAVMHERWQLTCDSSLLSTGKVSIEGLNNVISDVLMRFENEHGELRTQVLNRKNPDFDFTRTSAEIKSIAPYYFRLGLEHIAGGIDHLVFVLGLLLLIQGLMNLLKTITAFTLAHSVTLAAAILGYVHVPSAPVEAVIALSIVFLAREIVADTQAGLSRRIPWLVAAIFGLVHGLGFAGGLSEIGLPESEIPLALLMFNLGVEAGQLAFVALALLVMSFVRRVLTNAQEGLQRISAYAIGSLASFWLIERIGGY